MDDFAIRNLSGFLGAIGNIDRCYVFAGDNIFGTYCSEAENEKKQITFSPVFDSWIYFLFINESLEKEFRM